MIYNFTLHRNRGTRYPTPPQEVPFDMQNLATVLRSYWVASSPPRPFETSAVHHLFISIPPYIFSIHVFNLLSVELIRFFQLHTLFRRLISYLFTSLPFSELFSPPASPSLRPRQWHGRKDCPISMPLRRVNSRLLSNSIYNPPLCCTSRRTAIHQQHSRIQLPR